MRNDSASGRKCRTPSPCGLVVRWWYGFWPVLGGLRPPALRLVGWFSTPATLIGFGTYNGGRSVRLLMLLQEHSSRLGRRGIQIRYTQMSNMTFSEGAMEFE